MEKNKEKMILWVYKKFFKKNLDPKKDATLIQNMATLFEVIEEVAENEHRLKDMFN